MFLKLKKGLTWMILKERTNKLVLKEKFFNFNILKDVKKSLKSICITQSSG